MNKIGLVAVFITVVLLSFFTSQAIGQQSSHEDFKEFCNTWEGRWVGQVTLVADWKAYGKRGDKVTAYCELKPGEDGNVLLARFYGGTGSATGVVYFDAGAKQVKWFWVNSGGGVSHDVVYKDGSKWIVKGAGSEADGTKTEHLNTITISDNGKMHTWTGSGKVGDQKTDDQHDVWRRVSQ